jgi:hypothetical protein
MTALVLMLIAQPMNLNVPGTTPVRNPGTQDGGVLLNVYVAGQAAGAGGLTNTELRASPLLVDIYSDGGAGVSGLTDAQLRASPINAFIDGGWMTVTVIGTVDTELPTAAALTDNLANPTAPAVGSFLMGWNNGGSEWERLRASPVNVDGEAGHAQGALDVMNHNFYYNGTNWDRMRGTLTDGLLVNLGANNDVTVTGSVAVTGTFWQATQPVSGTFWQATQPVSGTVTATGPLTDTQLRATPVPVSGSVTATVASTTITGTVAATQSGTWTVQPGNTANTTPWLTTDTPRTVASANNTGTCTSVTASTTVLASNASRRAYGFKASEDNTAKVHCKLGATATTSNTIFGAGAGWSQDTGAVYTGVIDCIAASGTQSVCVYEVN